MLTYVKGQGWVCESLARNTRVFTRKGIEYRVWFERREPEAGEHGWNLDGPNIPEDKIFKELETQSYNYDGNDPGHYGWLVKSRSRGYYNTITVFTEVVS